MGQRRWLGLGMLLGVILLGGGSVRPSTAAAAPFAPNRPAAPALPAATKTPSATPTPPCLGQFEVVSTAEPPNVYDSRFEAIAARNTNDIWAVGEYDTPTSSFRPLINHWDGSSWSLVPSPIPGMSSELHGVVALGAGNAWAVGYTISSGSAPRQTLIERWDGTAWTIVPSPNQGSSDNELAAVAALGPSNIWAVGHYDASGNDQPLILHWNGTAWSTVSSPTISAYGGFDALSARTASDIWAVGYVGTSPDPYQALVEHWDGTAWSVVTCANPGTGSRAFWGVAAVGASDVWAVGQYNSLSTSLIEHWNGASWSVVPSPNVGTLHGIEVRAADDIWASSFGGFVLHWDGNTWTQVPTVSPSSDASLQAIAAAGTELWTVGYYSTAGFYRTLIEHDTPGCLTPSATPTETPPSTATPTAPPAATKTPMPTGTPTAPPSKTPTPIRTPSATPSPVKATATMPPAATPTVCALAFTDVPPGSTFYDVIRCLACRGIVGGYPCGGPGEPCPGPYFRPTNNVTRGQTAKLVSTSAGLPGPIPTTRQTFEDVPPGSTFWLWVEQLAGGGILGGYLCGGPGEPCLAPLDRPYYRPNTPVTRSQLAKIVAGAAGYSETPTGQTFADVPPGSTFYLPVERLASRGIMSGYPCGGGGEPCLAPANRPYFRLGNQATRGQAAKIIANSFFPGCQPPAPAAPATGAGALGAP